MNSTSPVTTGAVGAVTGAVVTLIAALVKHYNIDLSADAQVSLAVGVVASAHWVGQQIAARTAKPATPTP
ncbi:hypothetical protein [Paraburkholderia elongata]|uniref:Holin n=1 Tax=Paraburkholderia elongata TaxID=2675747 RepID=A0A972SKJ1_9BURK|nr:hypothetical protein [Paraburkholderia elongata]NPT59128.1 hypothetical protein [Paraburkholderia elongata]